MRTEPSSNSQLDKEQFSFAKRCLSRFDRRLRRARRLFECFPPGPYQYVLDVGAHEGSFTDLVLRYFRTQRVWLVEADPRLVKGMEQKYLGMPHCKVIHAAISDRSGAVDLRINRHRASSSLLPINPIAAAKFQKDMQEIEVISVPALSLGELFAREEIERVDLMKVDIQGAEKLLIQGGREALKRTRLMYIEVLFEELYKGCALFCEIQHLLSGTGFRLQFFNDLRRDAQGVLLYANALYSNQSFSALRPANAGSGHCG